MKFRWACEPYNGGSPFGPPTLEYDLDMNPNVLYMKH